MVRKVSDSFNLELTENWFQALVAGLRVTPLIFEHVVIRLLAIPIHTRPSRRLLLSSPSQGIQKASHERLPSH